MKQKLLVASLIMLIAIPMLTSCRVMKTDTPVGDYRITEGKSVQYARGKQLYLFWGLVRLGKTSVATPPSGNCNVRTYETFWDRVLTSFTGGIFAIQTIQVDVKRMPVSRDSGTTSGRIASPSTQESDN